MTNKFTLSLRSFITTLALFLVFTVAVNAQDKVQEGAVKVTAHMKSQLSLNDGQYSRVLAINKDYLQKVVDNPGATVVQKSKNKKVYDEERDGKLKSVLNDSQYKIYVANRSANARVYKEVVDM
ncbi:hypothetical protein FUA48_05085 [Flavobacterium alkalisoli]|uniref:Uncharacterized protein n=1 Tax=Flavobacterium alkalisoli TaxID=2602769 RepID=A0A5B9FPS0_9FLAO|nr:hypothetical protein [Flavobacterium alkalisoli]QEE48974.1 hypothetical protein FUA48_05085 [Flavobacterium alkalisoli]